MSRIVRTLGFAIIGVFAFALVGCGESDEMPIKPLDNGQAILPPSATDPSFEDTIKYVVNLGNRAATKPRQNAADALDKVEKKIKAEKPFDAKKLEQIAACRAMIVALGEFLRDQTLLSRYIQPKTSPDISIDDAEKKLQADKDAEYLKLKATFDKAKAKYDGAVKKMMDVAGEYKVNLS